MIEAGSHVLVFPYPAQGHMLSLLDLTHQLVNRGLSITILVTPKNLPLLDPLLSSHASIKALVLPFPKTPLIPPGVENAKNLPPTGFHPLHMMRALGELRDPLTQWFKTHPSPPVAIISDMFLGWTHHLAVELGVPRYVFSPSGAMALAIIYSLWANFPKRKNASDDDEIICFPKLPKCPKYPWWQLSPIYRNYLQRESHPDYQMVIDGFLGNLASYGLVINTFSELECVYVDYFKKELGHERVWAVGPLLPPDDDSHGYASRGGSSVVSASEILSWLDVCEDDTVLYVCFGSQHVLTNDQMEAVAFGLEKSGMKFIWSVKGATDHGHVDGGIGTIPSGLEDRVAGRGLIVKGWVPQVVILRHRAVGTFLTHCGWNSVLESLVAGVPLLTWPMGADQFVNASLLVDELKVAIKLCEGSASVPHANDFASVVAKMMEPHQAERARAKELSKAALDAVRSGGDSFKSLDEFFMHLAK